jgi:hypothetical protein
MEQLEVEMSERHYKMTVGELLDHLKLASPESDEYNHFWRCSNGKEALEFKIEAVWRSIKISV